MIDLEILRLELNYLIAGVKEVIGESDSEEICEAINLLVYGFLNPTTYTYPDISDNLQLIEESLLTIQESMESNEYEIFKSNLTTISILLDKIKFESTVSLDCVNLL